MARTTPAQKPRGEQSSTLSTGFGKFGDINFLESAQF
jgi:hypothetical protein